MRKRTQMSLLVMTGLLSTGLGGCGTPKTQTAPETGNSESQSVSSSSIVKESHSVVDSSEAVSYTHLDVYKRQAPVFPVSKIASIHNGFFKRQLLDPIRIP